MANHTSEKAKFEHETSLLAKRVTVVDAFGGVMTEGNMAVRIDTTTTPDIIYIGKAQIGTLPTAPNWQIQKIDKTSGIIITWALGTDAFTNIWDDRTTITYS